VGAAIATESEGRRESVLDVATAAGKRLSEALRSLEEYGKLIDAGFASRIEKLRYRGYELDRRLVAALQPPLARQWRVCVIVTESLCTQATWTDVVKQSLDAGANCLQLREKHLADAELLDRAAYMVEQCGGRRERVAVIVNDRPDVAQLAGADGVHLGAGDLPLAAVRAAVGRSLILGASTHSPAEAKAAVAAGADYCGVGAMFETPTKPVKPAGLAYLSKFLGKFPAVPHLAIGGIDPSNIASVAAAGARGVAVCSCVCSAVKPATVVRELVRAMRGTGAACPCRRACRHRRRCRAGCGRRACAGCWIAWNSGSCVVAAALRWRAQSMVMRWRSRRTAPTGTRAMDDPAAVSARATSCTC
jgi:thiamine-phosphate pyrophosphorylase